jgi:hypothetical protein
MKPLIATVLAMFVALAAAPSPAQAPEPTYDQTRDWVVRTLNDFTGYTRGNTVITYRDISMDSCRLRYTVSSVTGAFYTDTDTFSVSLDSVKSVLWGTVNDPPRAYVLFTTASPITFNKRRVWTRPDRQAESINSPTTIGALEFGKRGDNYAEIARKMNVALLHAADLCKVQLAAK